MERKRFTFFCWSHGGRGFSADEKVVAANGLQLKTSGDKHASTFINGIDHSFYDNCRNSRVLIGSFLSSICGQTHEFEIHATRQRARAGNSTICYRKKQIDVSF